MVRVSPTFSRHESASRSCATRMVNAPVISVTPLSMARASGVVAVTEAATTFGGQEGSGIAGQLRGAPPSAAPAVPAAPPAMMGPGPAPAAPLSPEPPLPPFPPPNVEASEVPPEQAVNPTVPSKKDNKAHRGQL